jgi:molybdate transport system permease protein
MRRSCAAVIASIIVSFPLMYQSAKAGFEEVDKMIERAARVDRANKILSFLAYIGPTCEESYYSGAILAFARSH